MVALGRIQIWVVLAAAWLGGCAPAEDLDARSAWLRDALLADNRDLLERAPARAAGKLLKMAERPYTWLRGTANLYWRDVQGPGGALRVPTAFAAEGPVGLVGDAHPENFAVVRAASGEMFLEINDFDGATHGPWVGELRRLALGFATLAAEAPGLDPLVLAEAVAGGYWAALRAEAPVRRWVDAAAAQGDTALLADLARRAERDGPGRRDLSTYTEVVAGERRLLRGVLEAPLDDRVPADELVALTADEAARVAALVALAAPTLRPEGALLRGGEAGLVVKDAARRLGAGVSSYAVDRFYALLEGPSAGPEDDRIVELKTLLDPPLMAQPLLAPRRARSAGERVVAAQRRGQQRPDLDPWLGYADAAPEGLVVRRRAWEVRALDVVRVAEGLAAGDWSAEAVAEVAARCGGTLAETHARLPDLSGAAPRPRLAAAVGPAPGPLVAEVRAFVAVALPRLLDDHRRLRGLIERFGPDLGYRATPRTLDQ